MKKYKFSRKTVNIKNENLEKMIEACIALPELTRSTVSEQAKVSLVTAGKLLTAMDECRFTQTIYKYPESGRPYKLHVINKNLSSMIIDLSAADCSVSIIMGDKSILFHKKYCYTSGVALFDNISSVLARACIEARELEVAVSAVSVILADAENNTDVFNTHGSPTIYDKERIADIIASIFGTVPLLQMTLSEALSNAVRFNRLPTSCSENLAYVYVGRDIKLCFLPQNGLPINCNPKELLISDGITLSDMLEETVSPEDFSKILTRVVNLAHCAFMPSAYIIEYDVMKFGSKALHHIKKSFALLSRALPEIVVRDHRSGIAPLGASAKAECEFIKLFITTTDKQKISEDS